MIPEEQEMEGLTSRQKRLLEFIRQYIRERGYPPTIKEMGQGVGLRSPDSVAYNLRILEQKGYLTRWAGRSRGLKLLEERPPGVPVLGRIAAGLPLYAEENIEGYLPLEPGAFPQGRYFALRVKGESMQERGILEGDYVVVREQRVANRGDIVVALVNQEATIKQFFYQGDQLVLQPANPAYPPIEIKPERDELQIIGKVVAVLRFL